MDAKVVYLNLPIKDVNQTRQFWTNLGFEIDEKFTGGETVCVIFVKDVVYGLFSEKRRFQEFTPREIATDKVVQFLPAIELESKSKVDEVIEKAVQQGATKYMQSEDYGWMYFDRFIDLDGHQWEILWSDITLFPKE